MVGKTNPNMCGIVSGEDAALADLRQVLVKRMENAALHGVSEKSIAELTEETLREYGKV